MFISLRFSRLVIKLFLKFNIFNYVKDFKFSILVILFSARFNVSKFQIESIETIFSIKLFDSSRVHKLSNVLMLIKFDVSIIQLFVKSSFVSYGNDTRFSILETLLFHSISSLTDSSPSRSGI